MNTVAIEISNAVLAVVLLTAVATDLRTHKIYNWLTLPAVAAGLVLNILPGGHGILFSLGGISVASVSLLMFILMRALGAGDVKLLCAVGALAGPSFTMWTLVCTAIIGGVLALAYAARRGVAPDSIQRTVAGGYVLAANQSTDALAAIPSISKAGKMPYAPAIALGVAATAILMHVGVV